MFKKILLGAAAPVAVLGSVALGGVAHAATPTTVTATTHVFNRPDSGNGGTWAYDSFNRTLTVTVAADQSKAPEGDTLYTATVADKGGFSTVGGAGTPNQFVPGTKILHNGVKGAVNGSISYTVVAPSGDPLTGVVPKTDNDGFQVPTGTDTTADWPAQAFANPALVTVTEGSTWSWTYQTACEKWVDSSANGDGNTANDGNITGRICFVPEPFLYGGHAVDVAPTRENVFFSLGGVKTATWVHFQIFGPGPIDGHQGWVLAKPGVNVGVYTGLNANHTYVSFYTPVTGRGSTTQIPGSHGGHVTFITNR